VEATLLADSTSVPAMTTSQSRRSESNGLPRPNNLAAELQRAKSALESSPLNWRLLVDRIDALRKRLVDERLQLAILGQFKRGKSTFINALLGASVLPVAVVPLTAVAIFISWGADAVARVQFKGSRATEEFRSADPHAVQDFLSRFVAEEQNPKNRLDVERVDLRYPAPILANGTVLIDTPGVGSSHQHNTEAAIQILPECDAAIFIVSADPPITEIEVAYLDRIKSKAARIFFVLNKLDYLEPNEQKIAIDFLRKVLTGHSLLGPSSAIFGISARDALAAKQGNNREEVDRSGITQVENYLLRDIAAEKGRLLEDAIRRKAGDILAQAIEESELRRKALTLPIEELTSKVNAFEDALGAIEGQRRTLRDLLEGDRCRLVEMLESRIRELRAEAVSRLTATAKQALSDDVPGMWEQKAQDSISVAIQNIFEAARESFREKFASETTRILATHQNRLDGLVESVRRTAAEIFKVPFAPQHEQDSFELGEDPYWITESISATLLPDPGRIIDHIVPLNRRRLRLHSRIVRQTHDLIIRNAENLRWAILRGIAETMIQTSDRLEVRMAHATVATRGVIEDVLARRMSQSSETEVEIATLSRLSGDLDTIRKTIAKGSRD
jgi:GTP-binding protein EngB required for normal cell division